MGVEHQPHGSGVGRVGHDVDQSADTVRRAAADRHVEDAIGDFGQPFERRHR